MTSVSVNSSSFTVTVNETTNVVTISSPYTVTGSGQGTDEDLPRFVYGNRKNLAELQTSKAHVSFFGDSISNSGETAFTTLFHAALFEWHPDQWQGGYFNVNASGNGPYVGLADIGPQINLASGRGGRQNYQFNAGTEEFTGLGYNTSQWIRGGVVDTGSAHQIDVSWTTAKMATSGNRGVNADDPFARFPDGKGVFIDADGERSIGNGVSVKIGAELIGYGTSDYADSNIQVRAAPPGGSFSNYFGAGVTSSEGLWFANATRPVSGSYSSDDPGQWTLHIADSVDVGDYMVIHSAYFGGTSDGLEISMFGDGGYRIRNHYPPGEEITIGQGPSAMTDSFHYKQEHLEARMESLGTTHALVFLGMNDISGQSRDADTVFDDYKTLLDKIRLAKPGIKFICLTLYRTGDGQATGENSGDNATQIQSKKDFNAKLIDLAGSSTDITVVDIDAYIKSVFNPNGDVDEDAVQSFFYGLFQPGWLDDPTHLNVTGASAIAGFIWDSVVKSNIVNSVNGKTGVVELTADDISDFTDTARAAMSVTGTGLSYNSSTGQIASLSTSVVTLNAGTSANNLVQLDGSARLPAVDGSQLTNLPSGGGGGNDYLSKPTYTNNQVRLFDDFLSVVPDVGPNDGNNQWWMFSGGSGVAPADRVEAGARGAGLHLYNGANDRYAYWGGMFLQDQNKSDGDELLWESRVKLVDGSATNGTLSVGVVNRENSLNKNDAPPNTAYSTFQFASLVVDLSRTNLATSLKTASGGGSPTVTDLGASYPLSSYVDTWFRLGVHCKYNATDDDYDVQLYLNGTAVGSLLTMDFDDAIVPFVGAQVGSSFNSSFNWYADWISYTVKIGTEVSGRTTVLDMDSL